MIELIESSLFEAKLALDNLLSNKKVIADISKAALILIDTYKNKGRVIACGNGGSMCDAMHFAEELSGRYRKERRGLSAIAISDPGHLTCVANDFGYEFVFSRFIETHGRKDDCLLAISTSGKSKNVINAVAVARSSGLKIIALTGKEKSELEAFTDICICTPAGLFADRVQELHIKVLHILIELVERYFFPENYK